ncbi:MAG: hypothetical protein LBF27_25660 [Sphingobacterium sp.]|jgi:hypothetical protein|nr:hypothetical protein [Sphingobacterium sp.]
MENQIKVGQSFEVAVITDNSKYPSIYKNGNTGIIKDEFNNGDATMSVGTYGSLTGIWYVLKDTYKIVGKLTITKVK